jgi:Ca2+/Na+ antiporter
MAETTRLSNLKYSIKKGISVKGEHKKLDNIFELSLIIVFLILAIIVFLYQVIPGHIRYWVLVGFTIIYFILLLTKLLWDRMKSK